MTKTSKTVVFFGSGPVAAASLESLIQAFSIEAVITKPVPPHHKQPAPVETLAKQTGLPILFASNKAELDAIIVKEKFESRLGIIVDFGVIVSEKTIQSFPLGILNSHFSLLPRWRGADPISFSILTGDDKTGVSLMLIEPALDTGKILVQKSLKILPHHTTPALTDDLVELSNKLLQEYVPLYLDGKVTPRAQPHPDRATYSRKLTKQDGRIDWDKPAEQLEREIRAYADWPKSYTKLAGKEVIVTESHVIPVNHPEEDPGDVSVTDGTLMVECGNGTLCIERLKPAGKKEMTAAAFLAGYGHLFKSQTS